MSRIGPTRLRFALTLLVAAPAAAQQTTVDLDPVDQTIEDISVLSMSLREVETGLSQHNDFSRVYRVHGRQDLFMRQQGGLYALFPESVYGVNKDGQILPLVPDGTVFYIGRPALLDTEPPPADPSPQGWIQGRIDSRIDAQHEPVAPAATSPRGIESPSTRQPVRLRPRATLPAIVSDEDYRMERLHSLMRRAAGHAARGRSSSSSK
ncbi:MAG: hypothetical protein ACYS0G_15050 [Planctomycetota bacterium]|jgi:hypothetical protein